VFEQVEPGAAIHLAFDRFQSVDLSLDRAVAPVQSHRCAYRVAIGRQAFGEAPQLTNAAVSGLLQPRIEAIGGTVADQAHERFGKRDRLV